LAALTVGGLLTVAACGGSSATTATQPTVTTTASTDATTADAADASTVDANTATVAELTAAFDAAGVPSASRWAREVAEYRPYPTDDPTFAKLRQELAKYNPSSEVVDAIVATLSL